MGKLETEDLACPNCDAQLNPPEGEVKLLVVKCDYCGSKVRLRRQQPPPASRAAPRAMQAQPIQISWQAEKVGVGGLVWVVVSVVLIGLIGGGVALFTLGTRGGDAPVGAAPPPAGAAVQEYPIVCSGPMSIASAAHRGQGVLLEARSGCRLKLESTTLESDGVALVAAGDAQLTLSNSTVTGGGAAALTLGGEASLNASNTTIRGGAAGVAAAGSAKVTLRNCTVSGTQAATRKSGSAIIDADDSNGLSP